MLSLHIHPVITQTLSRTRQYMSGLSLQSRFMVIMGISSLIFTLLLWLMFNNFTEQLLERFGARFAEKQMLYDRERTLQPLIREIALARQATEGPLLKEWAANEHDPKLYKRAMEKMDTMRNHFRGGNYFAVLLKSRNLYYNDSSGTFDGRQLRYTLDPTDPDDGWFFDFIQTKDTHRVRVATNHKLGVSKIWIRVPIIDGDEIVGVLGTGIDLDDFTHNVSNIEQPGVTNMFINQNAVIQIYNDDDHIDFPGVFNASDRHYSSDEILDIRTGRKWVHQAIMNINEGHRSIETEFVSLKGKRYLAGIIALPEVGWYDLTLLDMSVLLPQADFTKIWLVVILGTLCLMAILAFSLHRLVLKPVAVLTDAAAHIRRGDYESKLPEENSSEVGKLASQFHGMVDAVHNTQNLLEAEIEKRTHQLNDAQKLLEISLKQEMERRETQANLMALMAHEMRNPVSVISYTAQMLRLLDRSTQPDWPARIEKIILSAKQLSNLMNTFLSEKWLDMDKHGLGLEVGDLNRVCAEVIANFREDDAHPLSFEPWDGDATFSADWQLVRIAIDNLLDNASKYSPLNSVIRLKILQRKAGELCVEVSDQGIGIPPELMPNVFEKFTRGRHESSIRGSGLGLYLVSWIAKYHGGHIEALSLAELGSTFRLCLPIRKLDYVSLENGSVAV